MESLSSLERLNLLEKKILALVDMVKSKNEQIATLNQENNALLVRLEQIENSMLKGTQNMDELNQERVLTKMVVDELISSIDKLVEHNQ